jgi:hypothetical protein
VPLLFAPLPPKTLPYGITKDDKAVTASTAPDNFRKSHVVIFFLD